MKCRKSIVLAALGVAAGTGLVLSQAGPRQNRLQPTRLEGAWIMTAPPSPLKVALTFAPFDSSGRRAAVYGHHIVGDPTLAGAFPEAEYQTPLVGEARMSSRNEGMSTVTAYGMKMGPAGPEIVYIVVDSGTFTETNPGQALSFHWMSVFLPSQDADGDGLPDPGQQPVACAPLQTISTRVPILPPCTPAQ